MLGQMIYLARLERKWSQKELAARAGVPQPNVSNIERGRDFKVSTLFQLSAALGVGAEELLVGTKPLAIDKKRFFRRDNIERTVSRIVNGNSALKPTENLFRSITGRQKGYIRNKDLHLSWAVLKRTFSREEMNAILSRIEKAGKRR